MLKCGVCSEFCASSPVNITTVVVVRVDEVILLSLAVRAMRALNYFDEESNAFIE